jgi:hypothetical protein
MLIAVGVVMLASLGVGGFFVLRAVRSEAPPRPSVVAAAPPIATPEPTPAATPAPLPTTPLAKKRYAIDNGTAKPSPPRLRFGALTVSGRLPPEVVQRIIRPNFGRFRMCYEQALATNPELKGRVSVRFVIGRDGTVSNVSDGGSDLPSENMIGCVMSAFMGLAFPRPEGGIVTVVAPLLFEPS